MRSDMAAGAGGEPPERPHDFAGAGFTPQAMVRWLDPGILVDAALRVVLSSLFGQYSDKRELQAAIDPEPHHYRPGDDGRFWLDFVADLGDGFDSTYAVASLLARPELELKGGERLPRGRVLVMGGDQVYPTPSREAYEDRFRGPYAAALPWAPPGAEPDLFAIPGNHDWYDGLTNFLRFFCARRSIGGWRTRQRRSYFGLRLPHRWWLLAIDIQLDTYIDEPQLDYFRSLGIEAGDRVILATGKPSWTKVDGEHVPESYKNVEYFQRQITRPAGAEVPVVLTGDLHHYARYEGEDGSHFITAGGGGAYLFPTHKLDDHLVLPDRRGAYRLAARYPDAPESSRLTRGAWKLPKLAPKLCAVMGVLYALLSASLYAAVDAEPGLYFAYGAVALLVAAALVGYCAVERTGSKVAVGLAHALVHIALGSAPGLALALAADGAAWGVAAAVIAGLAGFLLGGVALGLYLIVTHRWAPKHVNDVLACQAIPDYKNFLRLRIDADGLTIYPIAVPRVPREWDPAPTGEAGDPLFLPVDRELEAEPIESPIPIRG